MFQDGALTLPTKSATAWAISSETPGQAMGAQFAQAKPEGAVVDGAQNWSLTSYNHNIHLDAASQRIGYSFLVGSTFGDLSLMLCGEGLG